MNSKLLTVTATILTVLTLNGCKVNHLMVDTPEGFYFIPFDGYSVLFDTQYSDCERENVSVSLSISFDSFSKYFVTLDSVLFINKNNSDTVRLLGINFNNKDRRSDTIVQPPVTLELDTFCSKQRCAKSQIVEYHAFFDITNEEPINAVISYRLTIDGIVYKGEHQLITKKHPKFGIRNIPDILLWPFYLLCSPIL